MFKYTCPSCKAEDNYFFVYCPQCGHIADFHELDPFTLLGLDPRFDIEEPALEKAYFDRQRHIHPDRFVKANASEKERGTQWSTALNEAYQRLKDPMTRARELYALLKGGLPAQTQGAELLANMMELQELLVDDPERGKIKIERQRMECLDALHAAFREDVGQVPGLLEKYSYLRRLSGD